MPTHTATHTQPQKHMNIHTRSLSLTHTQTFTETLQQKMTYLLHMYNWLGHMHINNPKNVAIVPIVSHFPLTFPYYLRDGL